MRTYDTAAAAKELGIPASAIWTWKNRGLVVPDDFVRGRGRGGLVPLYRLSTLRPHAISYLEAKERLARHADKERR